MEVVTLSVQVAAVVVADMEVYMEVLLYGDMMDDLNGKICWSGSSSLTEFPHHLCGLSVPRHHHLKQIRVLITASINATVKAHLSC